MLHPFIKKLSTSKKTTVITPTQGAHKAYLTAKVFHTLEQSIVVVLKNAAQAHAFMDDLRFFLPKKKNRVLFFPGYHILPFKSLNYHKETSISRLAALSRILDNRSHPLIIVTVVDTILQKLIPRKNLDAYAELVMANEEIERDDLILKLEAGGYMKTSLVEDPGEYSVRGGILDVFSPGETHPVRIEFFGDLVESIRTFSPFSQRGIRAIAETILIPATEAVLIPDELPHILARLRHTGTIAGISPDKIRDYVNETREFGRFPGIESMLSIIYDDLDTFFDYIRSDTLLFLDDPEALKAQAEDFDNKSQLNYQTTTAEKKLCVPPDTISVKWDDLFPVIDRYQTLSFEPFELTGSTDTPPLVHEFRYSVNTDLSSALKREGVDENPLSPLVDWVEMHQEHKRQILCVLNQESQVKRLLALLQPYGLLPGPCTKDVPGVSVSDRASVIRFCIGA